MSKSFSRTGRQAVGRRPEALLLDRPTARPGPRFSQLHTSSFSLPAIPRSKAARGKHHTTEPPARIEGAQEPLPPPTQGTRRTRATICGWRAMVLHGGRRPGALRGRNGRGTNEDGSVDWGNSRRYVDLPYGWRKWGKWGLTLALDHAHILMSVFQRSLLSNLERSLCLVPIGQDGSRS